MPNDYQIKNIVKSTFLRCVLSSSQRISEFHKLNTTEKLQVTSLRNTGAKHLSVIIAQAREPKKSTNGNHALPQYRT